MKLAGWARRNGVHPQTAYRWFREGTMPVPARRLPSGTIMVDIAGDTQGRVVVYARVSSAYQRTSLCARLYGRRAAANRASRAVVAATAGDLP
ncbi:recombinase family protein [Micromonospora purpureochromogenes]|uniref:Site-specific integrase-resolvase n=1 Tax=Micromonospora purpureochromogenes TaxID=47872 RepID=A0ABX2RQG7_9ACTN|nr:recombinase family protein [Micromonospora purpureochromogenes]NYF57463.1 putative site-specific integrase-resolvase [Micromonospora purpureochromogenes]